MSPSVKEEVEQECCPRSLEVEEEELCRLRKRMRSSTGSIAFEMEYEAGTLWPLDKVTL